MHTPGPRRGVHPTGGTFTLTYRGKTTRALAFDAPMATIKKAVRALHLFVSSRGRVLTVKGGRNGRHGIA